MIKKIILTLIISACVYMAHSQDSTAFMNGEQKISKLIASAQEADSDSLRLLLSKEAADQMSYVLDYTGAFDYGFPNLKQSISSIYSDNGLVRVITFGIELKKGQYTYQGFVLHRTSKTAEPTITRLFDDMDKTPNPMQANMQANNWYGAIYYEIVQQGKKSAPVYALCGWDGADLFTNRKILEQMTIDRNGCPKFGGSFEAPSGYGRQESIIHGQKRVIFQFTEKAVMSLQYNKKMKMIVADHLKIPPEYGNNARMAGPDWTFDGYYYDGTQWRIESDIDVKLEQR